MSNRKWLVPGRRESLPMTRDEAFCQNAFEQIDKTISELEDELMDARDLETIKSLQFDITEYRKRREIVMGVLTEIHGHRDYADDQYFKYVSGSNENADTIEAVAQYLQIDIGELARNSQKFLSVMHQTRLIKIASQTFKKKNDNEAMKRKLEKANAKIETVKLAHKEQKDVLSRHENLINDLNAELQRKNRQVEESQKMIRDTLERVEQTRSMYERELQERDKTISRHESDNKAYADAKEQ